VSSNFIAATAIPVTLLDRQTDRLKNRQTNIRVITCVCMYIRIYTDRQRHIDTRVIINTYTYIRIYLYVSIYIYVYNYVYLCVYTCTRACVCIHV